MVSIFLNTHLGYPLNDIVKIQLSPFRRGIVGKNWSAQSKTTVRSIILLFA